MSATPTPQYPLRWLLAIEGIWWLITAVVAAAVIWPARELGNNWPFYTTNVIFVVTLITLARHIFLLPFSLIGRRQVLKIALILAMFPITFWLVSLLQGFMAGVDERGWETFTGHLPLGEQQPMNSYLWNEMLFFGAGSVLSAPLFAVRLFMSVWRFRNRGQV
jgi:hypothetical protein